jgi:RimJ/RimL family protein N-acetyltransferase
MNATPEAAILPLLDLRIAVGPFELRGVTDDLLTPLADRIIKGIHDPDNVPFSTPWSIAPAEEIPSNTAKFHWKQRASFTPAEWAMDLVVLMDGQLIGYQGFSTRDFLVTRVGETGSWLGRELQGRGIGTAIRKIMCQFIFDHLDAEYITSAALASNSASLAVSRKVGYTENGVEIIKHMGKSATLQRVILKPENLVRYEHRLTVDGLPEFRRSIGL